MKWVFIPLQTYFFSVCYTLHQGSDHSADSGLQSAVLCSNIHNTEFDIVTEVLGGSRELGPCGGDEECLHV